MIIILRTLILYTTVVCALRFMGKKQIGQLEPSELAIAIMISELASLPLAGTDVPLLNGIIPVLILSVCEILVSAVILKKKKLRTIITGHPTILIKNGRIIEAALKSLRYTVDDILVEMRLNGISRFDEIEYAILETNGQLSFIPNAENRPATAGDMDLPVKENPLPFPVICGGVICDEYLKIIGRDKAWLLSRIREAKINDLNSILILMANHDKIDYYQLRSEV